VRLISPFVRRIVVANQGAGPGDRLGQGQNRQGLTKLHARGFSRCRRRKENTYHLDEKGRRKIEPNPAVRRAIHFFGDSMTFGHGLSDQDAALNLLGEKLNDRINVFNYGVPGYGFEQMLLRLIEMISEIKAGDTVFSLP
jgi:hypothetical protein